MSLHSPSSPPLLHPHLSSFYPNYPHLTPPPRYAVSELKKDIAAELATRPEHEAAVLATQTAFGIFVVHNKKKAKIGQLTDDVKYFPGMEVDDVWLDYPWEVL